MRGARIPTRQQRQQPWRAQRNQLPAFVRSQQLLTARVRQEARQLSGPQLRALPSGGDLMQPYVTRQKAYQEFHENVKEFLDCHLPRATENLKSLLRADDAKAARDRCVAKGLCLLLDADGNVIRLDARDRPYVVVDDDRIVYVKVYQARITPKGLNLDAQCTAAHPDGTREVLLVEPEPTLGDIAY